MGHNWPSNPSEMPMAIVDMGLERKLYGIIYIWKIDVTSRQRLTRYVRIIVELHGDFTA